MTKIGFPLSLIKWSSSKLYMCESIITVFARNNSILYQTLKSHKASLTAIHKLWLHLGCLFRYLYACTIKTILSNDMKSLLEIAELVNQTRQLKTLT